MMGILYRLDFPSGKSYVGITRKSITHRMQTHASAALAGSDYLIHRAWRVHGVPPVVVLAVLPDGDLLETERRAVAVYGTMMPRGYNMTPGGEVSPTSVPEIAARMSANHPMKRPEYAERIAAKLRGRKLTEEQRAKMCGRPKTLEHRAKLAAAHIGMKASAATRAKMSAARTGLVRSASAIAKAAAAIRGRRRPAFSGANAIVHRPGVMAKIVAARLAGRGYAHSEETKAKLSAAAAARWSSHREKGVMI